MKNRLYTATEIKWLGEAKLLLIDLSNRNDGQIMSLIRHCDIMGTQREYSGLPSSDVRFFRELAVKLRMMIGAEDYPEYPLATDDPTKFTQEWKDRWGTKYPLSLEEAQ